MPSASTSTNDASAAALADIIRTERVRFVFIQSAIPTFFSPLAAAILSFTLRDAVDQSYLTAWTLALLAIAIMRVLLVRSYPKTDPNILSVKRWEKTFVISILVVDLSWGLGAWLLLPEAPALRALVFAFVMLMASGHASSFAAHPTTVVLGVLALAAPVTVCFALQPDAFHRAMAAAAFMYLLATFRSIRTLGYFFAKTHRLAHALQQEKDRVERLARLDFLTEMNNRRAFYESGERSLRLAERHAHATSLLMLDIDHFKAINDKFGHAVGDVALKTMAELIRSTNRDTDIAGRLGGEEFAVLLPQTQLKDALVIAERLRQKVAGNILSHDDLTIQYTTSIGVAQAQPGELLESLIARADTALYAAKHGGRNQVVAA